MEVTHTDRRGNRWRFSVPCTPYQFERLRGLLAAARNMGGRDVLTLSGIRDADANAAFYSDVEGALLAGLLRRFPPQAAPMDAAADRGEPQPVQEQERPTPSPAPADDEPRRFWWEDL